MIAGPPTDVDLLRFIALYLRSSLAQYFMVLRSWKMLCERNAVHLADIARLPFVLPHEAPSPQAAERAVRNASGAMDAIGRRSETAGLQRYRTLRETIDESVFSYFQVTTVDRRLVQETVKRVMPAIRPRSQKRLDTLWQRSVVAEDLHTYARELGRALDEWRARTSGTGRFDVSLWANDSQRPGALGIVRIGYAAERLGEPIARVHVDDDLVIQVLEELGRHGLAAIPTGGMRYHPDTHIWLEGRVYVVRYLMQRSWTLRQALRDAERIFRDVRRQQLVRNPENS